MWYFNCPQIVYGDGALSHLETLVGRGAFIVTDQTLMRLGWVDRVLQALAPTGMRTSVFVGVEAEPCFETVLAGAEAMCQAGPDWIIALGGGSVMDAAKAMWVLYERPDLTPELINPIEPLGLRQKARLVAIPTTAGTGAEATWAIVLTDAAEGRKLALGSRENLPDLAILDPELVANMPRQLTADTGLDALTHAVEGFTTTWYNDFSDGLCLKAAQLVFDYLPAACQGDEAARARLQNAAALAGMGFGNAMAGLAHGMGHSMGAVFHVPHGRAVALFLPYTIEYAGGCAEAGPRFTELARFLGLPLVDAGEDAAARTLAQAIRRLYEQVGQPLTIADCGITTQGFEDGLERLVDLALTDSQTIMAARVPESDDLRRLFWAAYHGEPVDF
jgi:alcohol dehydrogenase class IV